MEKNKLLAKKENFLSQKPVTMGYNF